MKTLQPSQRTTSVLVKAIPLMRVLCSEMLPHSTRQGSARADRLQVLHGETSNVGSAYGLSRSLPSHLLLFPTCKRLVSRYACSHSVLSPAAPLTKGSSQATQQVRGGTFQPRARSYFLLVLYIARNSSNYLVSGQHLRCSPCKSRLLSTFLVLGVICKTITSSGSHVRSDLTVDVAG